MGRMKSIFRGAGYETEERYFEEQNRKLISRQIDSDEQDPSAFAVTPSADPIPELNSGLSTGQPQLYLVSSNPKFEPKDAERNSVVAQDLANEVRRPRLGLRRDTGGKKSA